MFEDRLKKCTTLKQIFDLVNEHYETNQNLGLISGNLVKSQIPKIITLINLKAK